MNEGRIFLQVKNKKVGRNNKMLDVGLPAHEHSRQIAGVPGLLDEGVDLSRDGHDLQFRTFGRSRSDCILKMNR